MAKSQGRIPRSIVRFHTYINGTTTYMTANANANATRLGLTTVEVTQWALFNSQDGLIYPGWSNKKLRNTDMTNNLKLNIKNCHTLNKNNKLLDRIAASPVVTLMDMEVFGIKKGALADTIPTQRVGKINETVVVSIFYKGGGRIKFQCRPDATAEKSHIPAGADHLEIRAKVGEPAPADPDNTDVKWTVMSSKAIVIMDFTPANAGKKAYLFFRWVDSKRPERNGAFTSMLSIAIA